MPRKTQWRRNQYSGGKLRDRRMPTMAVSEMERTAIEVESDRLRLTMAQLVRCGLVLLGVFDTTSLDDIPEEYAAQISSGKGLGPLRKVRS